MNGSLRFIINYLGILYWLGPIILTARALSDI
jgi:hypothetical protein